MPSAFAPHAPISTRSSDSIVAIVSGKANPYVKLHHSSRRLFEEFFKFWVDASLRTGSADAARLYLENTKDRATANRLAPKP